MKDTYEVGDWVKLPSKRPSYWNSSGKMDKYLGLTVQITDIMHDGVFIFKGSNNWRFHLSEVERKVTKEYVKIY